MIYVLLLSAIPTSAPEAPSEAELLSRAEAAYRDGLEARDDVAKARPRFRASASDWERLWQLGYHNPSIAQNMAQAYLLAGDLANAIRAYHLGLRESPSDRTLQSGLAYARQHVAYLASGTLAEAAKLHDRKSILHIAPVDLLWGTAIVLYVLGVLAATRAWMTRRGGWRITSALSLLLAAAIAGSVVWAESKFARENRLPLVIVAENGTPLLRGNNTEYPRRLPESLPAGVELRVRAERGGWLQVELADGTIGWVSSEQVIECLPAL